MVRTFTKLVVGLLCSGLTVSVGAPLTGLAADGTTPATFASTVPDTSLVRQPGARLQAAAGRPVTLFTSSSGTGPTELEAIRQLYPAAVGQLPVSQQQRLNTVRLGSKYSGELLIALAPSSGQPRATAPGLSGCLSGCSSTVCPDQYNCDFFYTSFYATARLNGYDLRVIQTIIGFRDNGDSVRFDWLSNAFNGTAQPSGERRDWSNFHVDSTGSYAGPSGCGCTEFITLAHAEGSWDVVYYGLCFCFPPGVFLGINIWDDMHSNYCVNEIESRPGYLDSTRIEHQAADARSWNAESGFGSGKGLITYDNWGLWTGVCGT